MASATPSAPRKRGRPQLVDESRIVDAAFAVGFDDLSMHSVARELGVSPTALYRYFASIDDLLARCIEVFGARIERPSRAVPWRTHLTELGWAFRTAYRQMPGAASRAFRLGPSSPDALDTVEHTLSFLLDEGFEPRLAWRAYSGVVDLATVTAIKEDAARSQAPSARVFDELPADLPATATVLEAVLPPDLDRAFDEQLDLLLDGLAARVDGGS